MNKGSIGIPCPVRDGPGLTGFRERPKTPHEARNGALPSGCFRSRNLPFGFQAGVIDRRHGNPSSIHKGYLVIIAPNGTTAEQSGNCVTKIAIGMDVRLDEFGNIHPWRVVVAFDGKFRQYFMRLPPDRRYVSPPENEHGDLTELPCSAEEKTEEMADFIFALGEIAVVCAAWYWNAPVIVRLRARGIEVEEIELPIPSDMTTDLHRIGGEAGHEISQLLDPDVREAAFAWQTLQRGEVSVQ